MMMMLILMLKWLKAVQDQSDLKEDKLKVFPYVLEMHIRNDFVMVLDRMKVGRVVHRRILVFHVLLAIRRKRTREIAK